MKKTLIALLVLAVAGGAIWSVQQQQAAPAAAAPEEVPADRHAFEAQGVVLRQLDAEGKLQYEIEAERIVQLSDGDVEATRLTFNQDPRSASGSAPRRWTLTAETGTFPAAASTVHLAGGVKLRGTRPGSATPLVIASEGLDYDMEQDTVCAAGEVEGTDQGIYFRSQGACVNVATGRLTVESGNGKISL